MRRLLGILLVLIIAVIGVLLVAPNFIPMDVYKTQIAQAAERATGRALTIDGDLSIAFFPRLQIELNDVGFANREGADPAEMAHMDRLDIRLAVLPLLRREVVVESFVLENPRMTLEIDSRGRGNWEFDIETVPGDDTATPSDGNGGFALNEISLGDVRLVDGDVRFRDRRSGADYHLQDIDLTVSLPTLQGPLGLDGQVTYNGERLTLDTSVAEPRAFIDGTQTATSLALHANIISLDFDGTAAMVTGGALPLRAGGEVDLNVPSMRRLAAWTGSPIESPGGFGPLQIFGQADANGDTVSFGNARLVFDEMRGTGNFTLNLGGARPRVNGTLALGTVDVRPYIGGETSTSTPRRRGNASSQWSTEPINLAALRAFDMDLNASADQVLTPTVQMGRSALDITLRGGVLTAVIEEMALYEGSGTARIEIDARQDIAVIHQTADISLVQALPLFRDLANFSSLEGVGNITMDLTTRGRSQRDFISALNGNGEIRFNDGALRGINLAQLVRTVGGTALGVETTRAAQQTDFAELGGTFQIRNGVVSNVDMRLLNPLLRVTGRGTTNLVNRTIEYRVDPQAVWTLEGQGSQRDITGLTVPVLITGTWDNLQFGPDVRAVGEQFLRNQLGGAAGAGTGAGGSDEEQPALTPQDIIRGLTGGGGRNRPAATPTEDDAAAPAEDDDTAEEDEEDDEPPTPQDLFRQLIGGGG